MTSTLLPSNAYVKPPVRQDVIDAITASYVNHIHKVPGVKKRNAYAQWIISNLEISLEKRWFNDIIKIFTNISEGCFLSQNPQKKLTKLWTAINHQSAKLDKPLGKLKADDLTEIVTILTSIKPEKSVNDFLRTQFIQKILDQYPPNSKFSNFFKAQVKPTLPDNFKTLLKQVPDLERIFSQLLQILVNPQTELAYVQRKTMAKKLTGAVKFKELEPERNAIGSSKKIISLSKKEFRVLLNGLRTYFE